MRKVLYALAVAAVVSVAAIPAAIGANDPSEKVSKKDPTRHGDNFPNGRAKKMYEAKQLGLQLKLAGKIAKDAKVAEIRGQGVQFVNEQTDRIFVLLVQFGNTRYETATDKRFLDTVPDPNNPGQTLPASDALRFDGPLFGQIGAPDRSVDNSTLWNPNYDRAHYLDMYFNRMKKYYEEQSSGRYSISGDVTEPVTVPYNEALYGRNYCGSITCSSSRALIRDGMAVWVKNQLDAKIAAGRTAEQAMAEIQAYLRTFDKQDRYDADEDLNFDEPDGFIDHFQIVHAGGDEAADDPYQGTDAIWSHRSYANLQAGGPGGFTGVNIGSGGPGSGIFSTGPATIPNNRTGIWVGDYTMQPENGGLGVFAHEFAHDLGLPDEYDTSGNTGGAENTTGFWTLMSSGSNIGRGGCCGIGDAPSNMSAWDKLQLGWLTYDFLELPLTQKTTHKLNAVGVTTKASQAVVISLPKSQNPLSTFYGAPTSGQNAWYSGSGPNLDNTMTRAITLPSGGPISLTMNAWYEMETCWDYAQLRVSTNGGTSWTPVHTNVSDAANENEQNPGEGITGISGTPKECDMASGDPEWVPVTADLSAYAGQTIQLQIRYWTDPFVNARGFEFDDLVLSNNGVPFFTEDAENAPNGWTLKGFQTTPGFTPPTFEDHYYIAEYRPYRDNDVSLATAYNFGFLNTPTPDWLEFHPYMPGMVVWYWDLHYTDNSVNDHPGQGEILPVDAHPTYDHWSDGQLMRGRIQAYDNTFGLIPTASFTLHKEGVPTTIPSRPAQPVFNDKLDWWKASDGHSAASHGRHQVKWMGVNVPKTGTQIQVKDVSDNGFFMNVQVSQAP